MTRAFYTPTNKMIELVQMANYVAMNCAYLEELGKDVSEYERQLASIEFRANQLLQDLRSVNDALHREL